MATVWDDKNHSSGEQFILSKKHSKVTKDLFDGIKIPYTKISESEYNNAQSRKILDISKNNNTLVFYFSDGSKNSYKVILPHNFSNSNFTWSSAGTSTDRAKMTEIKELASLCMMLSVHNKSKILTEEEVINFVKTNVSDVMDYWKAVYYTSAIAHANLMKTTTLKTKCDGERQQYSFTKEIYALAKKLTSKAADNWNPSDVWFWTDESIVKKLISDVKLKIKEKLLDTDNIAIYFKDQLDVLLAQGILVGVSLKQVDKGNGSSSLITFDSIKNKSKSMDFTIKSCIIRDSKKGLPAYGELKTKSGFNIKFGGRANATKANINIEGQMDKATHQLGAIDAKVISKMAAKKKIKIYKDSDFNIKDDALLKMLNSIKSLKLKYFKGMTNSEIFNKYGFVEIKRYIANASMFNFINSCSKDDVLDMFLLAKKIDTINPDYYIFS